MNKYLVKIAAKNWASGETVSPPSPHVFSAKYQRTGPHLSVSDAKFKMLKDVTPKPKLGNLKATIGLGILGAGVYGAKKIKDAVSGSDQPSMYYSQGY